MTPRLACLIVTCLLGAGSARADRPAPDPDPAEPAPAPVVDPPPRPSLPPQIEKASPARDYTQAGEVIGYRDAAPMSTAQEYLVLANGVEVGGTLRTITADGGVGGGRLKLTDLALFDAHLEWAIAKHYELDAQVSILAKQPSRASEDIVQGGSLTLRRALGTWTAGAIAGSVTPLLDLGGLAYGGSLFVTHKKRLNEIVTFALAAGASSTVIAATTAVDTPWFLEGAGHAAVLVRIPNGVWGGWLGAGYALPAYHHGHDPVSGMALDPQPRLDIDIGTGVELSEDWYLSADLAILDRGDLANPATRLPVLDGGFDQIQITVGVTRRIRGTDKGDSVRGISDPLIQL